MRASSTATGGEQAYTLLLEALRDSGRTGTATFVIRTKPRLVAVEAVNDTLALSTTRFREEMRSPSGLAARR